MRRLICLSVLSALPVASLPAMAQRLGDGDYEICSVYDRDDNFAGYDSVCLEERRAALRYLNQDAAAYSAAQGSYVYHCPAWANAGNGYNMTWYSNGQTPIYSGTFDSTLNGRPCIANPAYFGTGYN